MLIKCSPLPFLWWVCSGAQRSALSLSIHPEWLVPRGLAANHQPNTKSHLQCLKGAKVSSQDSYGFPPRYPAELCVTQFWPSINGPIVSWC